MKLNKKEGIIFLEKIGLPTVKQINPNNLTTNSKEIEDGLSVRLSPKRNSSTNVYLPSIHNCTDLYQIIEFMEKNKEKYDIIIHKTVKPEIIGSVSKLDFRDSIVLETYRNFEERKKEIITNRVVIPILGNRMYISGLEMMKKDKNDFYNFSKVIQFLKDIPFKEYDMEYVIENGKVIFTDLTLPDNREYNSFKEYIYDDAR